MTTTPPTYFLLLPRELVVYLYKTYIVRAQFREVQILLLLETRAIKTSVDSWCYVDKRLVEGEKLLSPPSATPFIGTCHVRIFHSLYFSHSHPYNNTIKQWCIKRGEGFNTTNPLVK